MFDVIAVIDKADQNIGNRSSRQQPDVHKLANEADFLIPAVLNKATNGIIATAQTTLKMFDITNFNDVFAFNTNYSYDESAVESIEQRRIALEGLFVDRILKMVDIKRPNKHYPPKSNAELRNIHQTVINANAAEHTKLSLLYYILLDCDEKTRNNAYSNAFEEKSFMPKRYQIFMKGLWHMDRAEFEPALQNLTHPSLIPTFQEEILETLVKNAEQDDMRLALAYYHTVQPALVNTHALDLLFSAIAKTSVTEAFFFLRGQSEDDQHRMLESLLRLVLHEPLGEKAAARGIELVNLPFTKEEEKFFEEYLTHGGGNRVIRARDFVMMRRIGTGRFNEALAVDCARSKAVGGLNWEALQEGLREGLGPRYDTSRMR